MLSKVIESKYHWAKTAFKQIPHSPFQQRTSYITPDCFYVDSRVKQNVWKNIICLPENGNIPEVVNVLEKDLLPKLTADRQQYCMCVPVPLQSDNQEEYELRQSIVRNLAEKYDLELWQLHAMYADVTQEPEKMDPPQILSRVERVTSQNEFLEYMRVFYEVWDRQLTEEEIQFYHYMELNKSDVLRAIGYDQGNNPVATNAVCFHPTDSTGYMFDGTVLPYARKNGITKYMLTLLHKEALARGVKHLTCVATDDSVRMLKYGLGFQTAGGKFWSV